MPMQPCRHIVQMASQSWNIWDYVIIIDITKSYLLRVERGRKHRNMKCNTFPVMFYFTKGCECCERQT